MDRRKIVKALGDNLQATRQAIADQPRRRHRRRQISHVRIAGPKQLVGHRLALAIDRDGPVGALASLVMGKAVEAAIGQSSKSYSPNQASHASIIR